MPAPIALFAYKRAAELQRTIKALQANYLAAQSDLYVFVDGPRRPVDEAKVAEVRALARQITGFRSVTLHLNDANAGCASAIIMGVSTVLVAHDRVIVVEDDIVTTPNFLDFINQGLDQYRDHPRIFSIGGYTFPFARPAGYTDDAYVYGRTCAWGWGIWADRWANTDWAISDFDQFMADPAQRRAFNKYGSDRVRMLRRAVQGEIEAWDIRLCYAQFKRRQLTLYPTVSKVNNIGFESGEGVNTNVYNRYQTIQDEGSQRQFQLAADPAEHPLYTRQFQQQFSLPVRVINRLRTVVGIRS